METNSQNNSEIEKSSPPEASENSEVPVNNCEKCGRAISQATGKCYYCAEADPEDLKKLNFLMLDWQHSAAKDPDARASENSKKVLSFFQALAASASIAIGMVPDFIPDQSIYAYFIIAALIAFSCWCFYFNSATLVYSVIANAAGMIFFLNLAFKVIPQLILPAFVCGFIASLCAFTIFLITVRIYKNKAVEI